MTEHEFLAEHGEYNEIYEIQCTICGHAHRVHRHEWFSHQVRNEVRPSRAYLTKFPYREPQSGIMVTSKEHREEVWKQRGYVKNEHGDHQFTETDLKIKERYRDRDPSWRNLRRKMGG